MSDPLRILQITDCHVSGDAGAVYRGIDPRETLTTLLPAVDDWRPDVLLLTGDLSEDGSEASYAWLAEALEPLDTLTLALPGNHDTAAAMVERFPFTAVDDPLVFDAFEWRLVLLNTAREGRIDGHLDEYQLASLEQVLHEGPPHALVAMHHQPVEVESPWIDRYPLRDPGTFWAALERSNRVRAVAWGHIHQPWDATVDGIRALGSPSTASNSLPNRPKFTPDSAGPAARWLELHPDGRLETGLLRCPG